MNKKTLSGPLMLLTSICAFLLVPTFSQSAENSPTSPFTCDGTGTPLQPLARRKHSRESSIHLIGMFDVHEGSRCHLLRPGGMEQVLMTTAVFENGLMQFDLNDTHIGFDIYDTCSNPSTALHHLIYALSDAKALATECGKRRYVGVIGPKNPVIQTSMKSFLNSVDIPHVPLTTTSLKEEIKAITRVLADLQWKMVSVFASTKSLEEEFREEANKLNICITAYVSTEYNERSDVYIRMKLNEISYTGEQVAVVLGSGIDLRGLFDTVLETNSTLHYWLLAGVDTEDDLLTILPPDYPVILFRKTPGKVPMFDAGVEDTYEFGKKIRQLNLVQSYIEYMDSCKKDAAGNLLNDSRCNEQLRHSNLQKTMIEESVNQLFEDMLNVKMLKKFSVNNTEEYVLVDDLDASPQEIEIWTYQHAVIKFSNHKETQVGHYNDGLLKWDKKILNIFRAMGSGWFKIPEFYCQRNCREICRNYDNISIVLDVESMFSRIYHWKHETWVNILLTVSCVGVIMALLTAIFLIINSCREDSDEGSQLSNIIVLVAIIISYCCTLLFMFHKDSVTCYRRLTIVGLAYICMLAPILSRCFLLIAAEMDGIHAHVSGFLQAALCFFISAVQIAMAFYFWMSHETIKSSNFKCVYDVKATVGYLSYSMLVSVVWLIASPFCVKCRRNNREGLLIHFGSIAVCTVWLVWFLLFFLLHPRWNEFTVCFGLVATATAIVVVVFVPRVYKIVVNTAAKQHGQVSMQPVIFASSSSRSPNLSIYESVNHGFNPDKDGFVVDVFKDDDDSPSRPRKMTHL